MVFAFILALHSLVRWAVLLILIVILTKTYFRKRTNNTLTNNDFLIKKLSLFIMILQLFLGLILYTNSSIVLYFFNNLPETLHMREIRFFGIEHSTMMPLAIIIFIYGTLKAFRSNNEKAGYLIWYRWTLATFLIIIASIPWSFWELVTRPLFRSFF